MQAQAGWDYRQQRGQLTQCGLVGPVFQWVS